LARLIRHRGLDADADAVEAGLTVPSPPLLRRLAPALGLHPEDVFVIAGVPVPEDLAPLDDRAGPRIPGLVGRALLLPPDRRRRLHDLVRSLPQESRTRPVPALRSYERYPPGPGAVVVGMLAQRNLRWVSAAKTLYRLTGLCLAGSTIGAVGHGRKELTPELLNGFATVLGVPVADLAVLTGAEPPDGTPPHDTAAASTAALIRDLRRLTDDQVRHVHDTAESLRRE
jgi:hypothetical protein